jgi:methionyl-tRNA formyltransferase
LEAGYPIAGVITAPDRLGGRGMKQVITSPVKKFALSHELNVLQPTNLKSTSFQDALKALQADLQVVVAFRMLPESVWSMPVLGTMNLHGSLLPAYRGAAPIHWAVINGEKKTGVTTFMLQHQIDTGDIMLQREIPITNEDDTGALHDRMMFIGAGLVVSSVDLIANGQVILKKQNESTVSHAPKIHHNDGHIDWTLPVQRVYNLIRGMSPFPGAWAVLDGKECKILKARIHSSTQIQPLGELYQKEKSLLVQANDGEIEILEIQMAGKRRMTAIDFMNGYAIKKWTLS